MNCICPATSSVICIWTYCHSLLLESSVSHVNRVCPLCPCLFPSVAPCTFSAIYKPSVSLYRPSVFSAFCLWAFSYSSLLLEPSAPSMSRVCPSCWCLSSSPVSLAFPSPSLLVFLKLPFTFASRREQPFVKWNYLRKMNTRDAKAARVKRK